MPTLNTNNMKICFCFSIKLMQPDANLDSYLRMIHKAVNYALDRHDVVFYTDEETLPLLKNIQIKKVLIDTDGFYYVDDFKVHLLSIVDSGDIIMDIDVFLWEKLELEDGYDLYIDYKDDSGRDWYQHHMEYCERAGVRATMDKFNDIVIDTPNIGIMQFRNDKLKQKYIDLYYRTRDILINYKGEFIYQGLSVVLGQYTLGYLLHYGDYKVCTLQESENRYRHFSGHEKLEKGFFNSIIQDLIENNIKIW